MLIETRLSKGKNGANERRIGHLRETFFPNLLSTAVFPLLVIGKSLHFFPIDPALVTKQNRFGAGGASVRSKIEYSETSLPPGASPSVLRSKL